MREYFCAYHSMLRGMRRLSDAECGRLFRALLAYSQDGTEPINLQGREEALFDVFADQIDRDSEKYESKCKQMQANGSKSKHLVANASRCAQEKEKEKEKEEDKDKEEDNGVITPDAHVTAADAPLDFNSLPAYASSNLQYLSPRNMEELLSFSDDLPDDLIRYAIDQGCAAGKRTWAYVRAILNAYVTQGIKTVGDAKAKDDAHAQGAKQAQASRQNPALNYPQRDYKAEDFGDGFYFDPLKAGYGGKENE